MNGPPDRIAPPPLGGESQGILPVPAEMSADPGLALLALLVCHAPRQPVTLDLANLACLRASRIVWSPGRKPGQVRVVLERPA